VVDFPEVMRILLVEDEADLGLAIKQVLISERLCCGLGDNF
jgi:two-component system, OmpR family, Ni(II)-responsive and/or redox-responsive regulator NrsR